MVLGRTIAIVLIGAGLVAQTPKLEFEVVAIHPAPDPQTLTPAQRRQRPNGLKIDGNRVVIGSWSLLPLIMRAFGVRGERVSGPDWMGTQQFDIQATMPEGASKDQLPEMFQSLLVERFQLALHRVSKEESGYALILGKPPLKLEPATPDADFSNDDKPWPPKVTPGVGRTFTMRPSDSGYGPLRSVFSGGRSIVEYARITPAGFADLLTSFLHRPVVDRTGLNGQFHITLDYAPENSYAQVPGDLAGTPADAASAPPGGDSIVTAVEKLGLKLEPQKVTVEHLVIDHVERFPTEN